MNKLVLNICLVALLTLLSVPGMTAEITGSAGPRKHAAIREESPEMRGNYKISFRIRAKGIDYTANVLALDGTQSHFVAKTTAPVEGVNEYGVKETALRKISVTANFLPVFLSEDNKFDVQVQLELSSEGDPVNGTVLIQVQTEFRAQKGKPVVLISDPDRHVELVIGDLN